MSVSAPLPAALAAELARQYDLLRELGRGGMGVVWLARERSLDRLVAIKLLTGDAAGSNMRDRFRREARVAARLVHPHIVPLHAFGETPDALYFVMGYVDGETLATRLDRDVRVPRDTALRILAEISDALAFAHREGVVHRDVKPENILLDAKSGRALLADFGVARVDQSGATSVTMTGVAVGTPSYMAPEQALGEKDVDGRADIYALGVVGYRMLMGRLPFAGPTPRAIMAQHAMNKPDDLTLAVAQSEQAMAQVIMRALEKEPAARWATAQDMRAQLESAATRVHSLPEELERVQGGGTKRAALLLLAAVTGNTVWFIANVSGGGRIDWGAFTLFMDVGWGATLATLGLIGAVPAARKFGWRETLRAMFQPPASWSSWWPRALRRSGDQWHRLPSSLRRARNAIAFVAAGFTAVWLTLPWFGRHLNGVDPLFLPFLGSMWGVIGWAVVEVLRARKKLGLPWWEFGQLLGLPNVATHPAWSKPAFARLLAPEVSEAPVPHAPRTPQELVHAITEIAERLRRSGLLPDGGDVAGAAEAARAEIAAIEADAQQLHRELDPEEGERIERRLSALGGGDAELKQLLEGQRAVWQRLVRRRQEKEARRDRLRDQLKTLWMQLLDLDARVGRGMTPDPELTGHVRAVMKDLSRTESAVAEVEHVLKPERARVTT